MTTTWTDLSDDDLASCLVDLGAHLVEGGDIAVDAVLVAAADRRAGGDRRWLVAAAVVVMIAALVGTIAPAREAVARWLGIGGVEVRTVSTLPSVASTTIAPPAAFDAAAVQRDLPFELRLLDPASAGEPLDVRVDPAAPSALVEIRYAEVTLVELESAPGTQATVGKLVEGGTSVEAVDVEGEPGLWLSGAPHAIGYLGPDGELLRDSVRRAGDVLVWSKGSVTYRLEGAASLADALALARSLQP